MAKGDKFYFENFVESTELSRQAAEYLVKCLENFDAANLEQMLTEMHIIEHSADTKKHEMSSALAKAFVTPVDREDLDMLSHQLVDVTDRFTLSLWSTKKISVLSFREHLVDTIKTRLCNCGQDDILDCGDVVRAA